MFTRVSLVPCFFFAPYFIHRGGNAFDRKDGPWHTKNVFDNGCHIIKFAIFSFQMLNNIHPTLDGRPFFLIPLQYFVLEQ